MSLHCCAAVSTRCYEDTICTRTNPASRKHSHTSDTYRTRSSTLSAVGKASSSVPMIFCRFETELPLDDCLSADTRRGPLPPRRGSWRNLTTCSGSSSSTAAVIHVNKAIVRFKWQVGSRFKQKPIGVGTPKLTNRLLAMIVRYNGHTTNVSQGEFLPCFMQITKGNFAGVSWARNNESESRNYNC